MASSLVARLGRGGLRRLGRLPEPVLRALSVRPPTADGVPLDLHTAAFLRLVHLAGLPNVDAMEVAVARRWLDRLAPAADRDPLPVASVKEAAFTGGADPRPVRIYRPLSGANPYPVILWFHGGGWVLGSLDSHDAWCRRLAADAHCLVVSVDYRLAPEHPFPAGVDDAVAVFRHAVAHIREVVGDPACIAVGGDSAGANLAAVVAQQTAADEAAPVLQILVYGAFDLATTRASHELFGKGLLLTEATRRWFLEHYLPAGQDPADPRVSPLHGTLGELPDAVVVTAGYDILRDEGRAYADALRAAGNEVTLLHEAALTHGFLGLGGLSVASAQAADRLVAEVKRLMAESQRSGSLFQSKLDKRARRLKQQEDARKRREAKAAAGLSTAPDE